MDQGDYQRALLPIDAGIDWQWVEENWDPTFSESCHAGGLFSIDTPLDWYPLANADDFTIEACMNVLPSQNPMSATVLQDGYISGNNLPSTEESFASSGNIKPTIVESSSKSERDGKLKSTKPRLRCSQPGCKATFPRNYELERHRANVHKRNFNVNCSVYGCSRVSKPFYRMDKLKEHMRKHDNPQRFLCILEDCRFGPLSNDELIVHLNRQHPLRKNGQVEYQQILNLLHLRETFVKDGSSYVEKCSYCPLKYLGCEFEAKVEDLWSYWRCDISHLPSHDLLQRSKGYEAISRMCGRWSWERGTATCPICLKQICDERGSPGDFVQHIINFHSKEERILHASTLAQMLRPYLIGKAHAWDSLETNIDNFKRELEEAGYGINGEKITGKDSSL